TLLRDLAEEGRTIFVSSHLMSEMAMTADHIIVIGRGRLLRDMPMAALIEESSKRVVRVRSPRLDDLAELLRGPDIQMTRAGDTLEISGVTTDTVGLAAAGASIPILELTAVEASLEEAYMALTGDYLEYGERPDRAA